MLRNFIFGESDMYKRHDNRVPKILLEYLVNYCHFRINSENFNMFIANPVQMALAKTQNGYQEQTYELNEQLNRIKRRLNFFYPTPEFLLKFLYDFCKICPYALGADNYIDKDVLPRVVTDTKEILRDLKDICILVTQHSGFEIKLQNNFDNFIKELYDVIKKGSSKFQVGNFKLFKPIYLEIVQKMNERSLFSELVSIIQNLKPETKKALLSEKFKIIQPMFFDFERLRDLQGAQITFTNAKYQRIRKHKLLASFINRNQQLANFKQFVQILIACNFNQFGNFFFNYIDQSDQSTLRSREITQKFAKYIFLQDDIAKQLNDTRSYPASIEPFYIHADLHRGLVALCSTMEVNKKIKASQLASRPKFAKKIKKRTAMVPSTPEKPDNVEESPKPSPVPKINIPPAEFDTKLDAIHENQEMSNQENIENDDIITQLEQDEVRGIKPVIEPVAVAAPMLEAPSPPRMRSPSSEKIMTTVDMVPTRVQLIEKETNSNFTMIILALSATLGAAFVLMR